VGLELSFWARPETAARSAKNTKKATYFGFMELSLGTESYTILADSNLEFDANAGRPRKLDTEGTEVRRAKKKDAQSGLGAFAVNPVPFLPHRMRI
jgi:hypothetical protein